MTVTVLASSPLTELGGLRSRLDSSKRLYVGTSWQPGAGDPSATETHKHLLRYDPFSDSWTELASTTFYHGNFQYMGIDSSNRLYAAGSIGVSANGGGKKVERYDPGSNSWTTLAEIPGAVNPANLGGPTRAFNWMRGDDLWLVGDGSQTGQFQTFHGGARSFSSSTGTWTDYGDPTGYGLMQFVRPSDNFNVQRTNEGAKLDNAGRLYIFGDWVEHNSLDPNFCYRFDPATVQFSPIANMGLTPEDSVRFDAAWCHDPTFDQFYILGGQNGANGNPLTNTLKRYDVASGVWTDLAPYPIVTRNNILVTRGDGYLYTIGDIGILRYDITLNRWTNTGEVMPGAVNWVWPDGFNAWYVWGGFRNNPATEPLHFFRFDPDLYQGHRVYGWGNNTTGQLGVGFFGNTSTPQQAVGLPDVTTGGARPLKAVSSGTTSVILLDDGTVWTVGSNAGGALGQNLDPNLFPSPTHTYARITTVNSQGVQACPFILDIAAGPDCYFLVTLDGRALGWGPNQFGSLGTPTTTIILPTRFNFSSITKASCGDKFSALLATTFFGGPNILTAGMNDWGQLGRATNAFTSTPVTSYGFIAGTYDGYNYFREIAAGQEALLFRRWNFQLWGCGRGDSYQLSDAIYNLNAEHRTSTPTPLSDIPSQGISEMRQAGTLSWFITRDGIAAYSWGNDVAHGSKGSTSILDPTTVPLLLDPLPGLELSQTLSFITNPTYLWGTPAEPFFLPVGPVGFTVTIPNNTDVTLIPTITFYDSLLVVTGAVIGDPIAPDTTGIVDGLPIPAGSTGFTVELNTP